MGVESGIVLPQQSQEAKLHKLSMFYYISNVFVPIVNVDENHPNSLIKKWVSLIKLILLSFQI